MDKQEIKEFLSDDKAVAELYIKPAEKPNNETQAIRFIEAYITMNKSIPPDLHPWIKVFLKGYKDTHRRPIQMQETASLYMEITFYIEYRRLELEGKVSNPVTYAIGEADNEYCKFTSDIYYGTKKDYKKYKDDIELGKMSAIFAYATNNGIQIIKR